MTKLFSYKNRPVHSGPYPLEKLRRTETRPDYNALPTQQALSFLRPGSPLSIVNALDE